MSKSSSGINEPIMTQLVIISEIWKREAEVDSMSILELNTNSELLTWGVSLVLGVT